MAISDTFRRGSWIASDSDDNAQSDAVKAAVAGQSHYVTSIHASFSAAAIKTLTLLDGTTTLATFDVHNQRDIFLGDGGLKITTGASVTARLAASGGAGNVGKVALCGYTAD